MNLEALGDKLRSVRKSRGFTLEQVSSHLGVTPSYLSEIERGKKMPSLKLLCNISTYLDLPIHHLRDVLEAPEDEVKSLPELLTSRREELGLTKGELSRAIGWPRSYIDLAESGGMNVPEKFLRDLGKALQLPSVFFEFTALSAIGKKVKFLRSDNDLTQENLAETAGLSTSLVSKIERGRVQPSLKTLAKISKALGVSPCCFVFQLSQASSDTEGSRRKATDESPASKKARLEEIISGLSELNQEQLDELAEHLTELTK
ncbi:helix-turn-helix domain-containing protein [Candidatus Bipolaricaulota bacterium]|nr:helix-turn-helix domain-containing protein [Candidatus Bipolaricaulota bacterium]